MYDRFKILERMLLGKVDIRALSNQTLSV